MKRILSPFFYSALLSSRPKDFAERLGYSKFQAPHLHADDLVCPIQKNPLLVMQGNMFCKIRRYHGSDPWFWNAAYADTPLTILGLHLTLTEWMEFLKWGQLQIDLNARIAE